MLNHGQSSGRTLCRQRGAGREKRYDPADGGGGPMEAVPLMMASCSKHQYEGRVAVACPCRSCKKMVGNRVRWILGDKNEEFLPWHCRHHQFLFDWPRAALPPVENPSHCRHTFRVPSVSGFNHNTDR